MASPLCTPQYAVRSKPFARVHATPCGLKRSHVTGASGEQVSSGLSKDMDAAWLACEALAARLDKDKGRTQPSAGVRELAGALARCSCRADDLTLCNSAGACGSVRRAVHRCGDPVQAQDSKCLYTRRQSCL